MSEINDLIFENLDVDSDFRWLLKQRFAEDDVFDLFGNEINLIPLDSDLQEKVDLPAVTLSIYQRSSLNADDNQLQAYTPFSVEINVYTSGDSKVVKNMKLCNIIIKLLQSNGPLQNYYSRGLRLDENNEVNTFLDSAYRRVVRMSGLCDNSRKLIR